MRVRARARENGCTYTRTTMMYGNLLVLGFFFAAHFFLFAVKIIPRSIKRWTRIIAVCTIWTSCDIDRASRQKSFVRLVSFGHNNIITRWKKRVYIAIPINILSREGKTITPDKCWRFRSIEWIRHRALTIFIILYVLYTDAIRYRSFTTKGWEGGGELCHGTIFAYVFKL